MEIVQQQSVLVCLAFLAAIGAFAFACIMRKVAVVMVVLGLLVASHVAMSACGGCTTTPTAARMGAEPTYHVLLTYHALDYILCGNIRAVDHVFARGEERMHGDAPPKEKLAKFKDVDYYVTIGAPVETKIEKTLRELNPKIKVFAATNGCHLIEHNHYLW